MFHTKTEIQLNLIQRLVLNYSFGIEKDTRKLYLQLDLVFEFYVTKFALDLLRKFNSVKIQVKFKTFSLN